MALRGKPPKSIEKRLKVLWYGLPGVGKTTAAIQFPRPYLIDTERGAENDEYVKLLDEAGGVYYHTTDPDELIAEIMSLISERHEFRTLIIDPLTIIYNDLLDKGVASEGTEFGRYKMPADRKIKHLLAMLLRLDMNVIITSHAKPNWVRTKDAKGKDIAVQEGITFDCYGRLDYLFDLVIEVSKRGKERVGIVRKTRIAAFPEGDIFPFGYDEIAERYGREIIERISVPVALASPDQIARVRELLEARKDGEVLQGKWLEKADAESWAEMPAEATEKCIAHLTTQAQAKAA